MKPLIGITVVSDFEPANERSRGKLKLNWNYAEQIAAAGGNPILITPLTDLEEIVPLLDGWLIPGGADMNATHFGEANHPSVDLMNPKRWEMEDRLFNLADPVMPILGICYGCQFMNVKRGGSLNQHLPEIVKHNEHAEGALQEYHLTGESHLVGITKQEKVLGKSYHHQAVNRVGDGLQVVAKHSDGTVEGLEDPSKPFFIGVQWHPERTPDDGATKSLFVAFIEAARTYAEGKR